MGEIEQKVLANIPHPVVWMNEDTLIVGCNDAYASALKVPSPNELIGKKLLDLMPPEFATSFAADLKDVGAGTSEILEREDSFKTSLGARSIQVSIFPIQTEPQGTPIYVVTFKDISALRNAEKEKASALKRTEELLSEVQFINKEIKEKQAALIQSAKMASLGVMSSGMAHEVNSPLAILKGQVDLIKLSREIGTHTEAELDQRLDTIGKMADRIGIIVKSLKAFSRDSENEKRLTVCLEDAIEDAKILCASHIRRASLEISLELAENAKFVTASQTQLVQIFVNLLSNSCDALEGCAERWIRVISYETNSGIEIEILDSGRKIPAEIAARMGDPFFTTKEVGKGTGLGLSVCKGIMRAYGGDLTYCEDHRNTCFKLLFPKTGMLPNPSQ